jgi:hypothetical protein
MFALSEAADLNQLYMEVKRTDPPLRLGFPAKGLRRSVRESSALNSRGACTLKLFTAVIYGFL